MDGFFSQPYDSFASSPKMTTSRGEFKTVQSECIRQVRVALRNCNSFCCSEFFLLWPEKKRGRRFGRTESQNLISLHGCSSQLAELASEVFHQDKSWHRLNHRQFIS